MSRKIEIPSYTILVNLIIDEIKKHKQELVRIIENLLDSETKNMLDALFEKEDNQSSKVKRYKLTLLKKFNQSTRPKKIKENIEDLQTLKELFQALENILKELNLTHEGIRYYAHSVIKSEIFQVSRRADEDRYLHLIAFVVHQFFRLQDILIDIFLIAVQNNINTATREHKEIYYERRKEKNESVKKVVNYLDKNLFTISSIRKIINTPYLSNEEKIERIQVVLSEYEKQDSEVKEHISLFKEESEKILKNAEFYCIVEAKSIKLQNRTSDIVKNIEFDADTSSKSLIKAINYYKNKDGNIDKKTPIDFLEDSEQDIIFDSEGKFRISLYKSLLFGKIADALKAGKLNLKYSYKYRSLDEYLISVTDWKKSKDEYLERTGLIDYSNPKVVLQTLEHVLDKQYNLTNENILNKKNEFIKFHKNGTFQLSTPKIETEETKILSELFPKTYISLLEILSTINKASDFLDVFKHRQKKYNKSKPQDRTFLAGIIRYGCQIGTNKIAKISKEINEHELENTINWYFSEDNISSANDKIIRVMDALDLPNIYRKNKDSLHTSSDGQKIDIAVDSLNSGYYFKYHGMNNGVNAYRFIDERNFLFHSNVFSSSEKEAAYVIDGLMHNNVVKSDIHSTDTDGYSEVIFAVAYLLGFYFAPRIKGLKKQTIYAFKKRKLYEVNGFKILPDKYINTKLIEENWDDILRFIATIKLKDTTASQLFKRLNSYSKQHRLYRALKEFGRIVKSLFILNYIDDVELRQAIEKQLNWNYLYLSQKISGENNFDRKQEVINAIKNGSVVTWRHINLHGEYDFSEEKLQDSIGIDISKVLEFKLS
jgi:TnpA family transposase